MSEHVGYVRVPSVDQNTSRPLDGIQLDKTYTDEVSGGTRNRPKLNDLIEYVRSGDTVHVHSIDRLARNLADLLALLEQFTSNGITVTFHKENLTFTCEDNPFQKLQLQVIGAVVEFERSMIKERQREGIAEFLEQNPRATTRDVRKRRNEILAEINSSPLYQRDPAGDVSGLDGQRQPINVPGRKAAPPSWAQ